MDQLQKVLKLIKERNMEELVPIVTSMDFILNNYEAGSYQYSELMDALIDRQYDKAEELIEYLIEYKED